MLSIFSRADSEALFNRIVALTSGGGDTVVTVRSDWMVMLRWGRNRPTNAGGTAQRRIFITRYMHNASMSSGKLDRFDDVTLKATVQDLEQKLAATPPGRESAPPGPQTYLAPTLWSDVTAQLTPGELSEAVRQTVDPVIDAGLVAAGYAEVKAASWAVFNTRGVAAYAAATGAMYGLTVRASDGSASGRAVKTHMDWAKLNVSSIGAAALQDCRNSAKPRAIEPGRYTAILLPDAVAHLLSYVVRDMDREVAEFQQNVFTLERGNNGTRGKSKIGLPMFDSRITITSDPTDTECGFIPFDEEGIPYRRVTWVKEGVLKELAYSRGYAQQWLHSDAALPNPLAYRVNGGETSLEEMISTTERGIVVAHLDASPENWPFVDPRFEAMVGMTRNGLWLVERGKIVHPIQNFYFHVDSLDVFNQVLQIGPAIRTAGKGWSFSQGHVEDIPTEALNEGAPPVVVPPMKVRDFNFTRLIDAV